MFTFSRGQVTIVNGSHHVKFMVYEHDCFIGTISYTYVKNELVQSSTFCLDHFPNHLIQEMTEQAIELLS